jgi:protein TonB
MNTTAAGILFSLGLHAAVVSSFIWLPDRSPSPDSAVEQPAPLAINLVTAAMSPPTPTAAEVPLQPKTPQPSTKDAGSAVVEAAADDVRITAPAEADAVATTPLKPALTDDVESPVGQTAQRVEKSRFPADYVNAALPLNTPRPTAPPTEPAPLEPIKPEYPRLARRMGLEGTVVLVLTIDEAGRIEDCRVEESQAHQLLVDAAVETAMAGRYAPGTRDSRPVTDTLTLRIVFRLET